MDIKAAAYGYGRFIFLADSASDEDVDGLLGCLCDEGISIVDKGDNGIDRRIGLRMNTGSTGQGKHAGELFIASQSTGSTIGKNIKLTLIPYADRLRDPKFIAGEVVGDAPIRAMLERYDPVIVEAIDEASEVDYNARFSGLEGKPPIRVQPEADQTMAANLGRAMLNSSP